MACQVQHRVIGVLDTALTQLDATISSGEIPTRLKLIEVSIVARIQDDYMTRLRTKVPML